MLGLLGSGGCRTANFLIFDKPGVLSTKDGRLAGIRTASSAFTYNRYKVRVKIHSILNYQYICHYCNMPITTLPFCHNSSVPTCLFLS